MSGKVGEKIGHLAVPIFPDSADRVNPLDRGTGSPCLKSLQPSDGITPEGIAVTAETLSQTLTRLTKHLPPPSMSYAAAEQLFLSAPPSLAATVAPPSALATPRPAAQQPLGRWADGLTRTYYALAQRTDENQLAALDVIYQQAIAAGPDFMRIRRNAVSATMPVVVFDRAKAAEIMASARKIEQESYKTRAKGKHGGAIGRSAMALLEWFCFRAWPMAKLGMFPSLAFIADGARMSKDTVVRSLRTLELMGLIQITRRRKLILTALGPRQVQTTNAYTLSLPTGIGALAMSVFAKPSGTENPRGIKEHSYLKDGQEKAAFGIETEGEQYGFWPHPLVDNGPS